MKQIFQKLDIESHKQFEIINITSHVRAAVANSGIEQGQVVVFSPHTTASVRINHNEPLLIQDILKALYRVVPHDISYNHDLFELREEVLPNERSNGHAHVKAFLLGSSESLIIEQGSLILGEKQSIFFVELDGGRKRSVYIKAIGE